MTLAMVTWIKQEIALRPSNPAEKEVASVLQLLGPQYRVLNNLILDNTGDNTMHTQIDHVVVSNYGIFCVETKAHKGILIARKGDPQWKQFIGKTPFALPNPLHQNYGHIKALDSCIAKGGHKLRSGIKSLVVFPHATKIMHRDAATFGDVSDVISFINSFTKAVYTPEERDAIYTTLRNASQNSYRAKTKHNSDIRANTDI